MQTIFSYHKFTLLITILCIGLLLPEARAQQLDFDEIKVIAPYQPTISDAFKIQFNPSIDDTLKTDIAFDYSINPLQIPTRFSVEPLSPARMRGEPLAKLYKGHVKAGLGNYSTPYAEAFYNTLRSNEYAYGVRLKHLSSGGGIDEYAHNGYADNRINLYGKRFLDNHTLEADLNYERNMNHFYGFRRDDYLENEPMLTFIDELSKKDIRQVFHYVAPAVAFRSNYLDSTKLQHNIGLQYHYLTDRYDATEHRLDFRTRLDKALREDPLGFAERQNFHMDLGVDYFHNKSGLDTLNTTLISVAPTLSSYYRDFTFYVGINASAQVDTVTYARFYPLAGAEVNLIHDVLFAYASLSGELKKQNLREISQVNPFVNTNLPLGFTNKKSELRGGFKGSISSFASYNISVSSSNIDNYPFFVTDPQATLQNQFTVIYDNIRLFNFRTEVFSNVGERLRLRFASDYFQYALDNELEPWHEPTMKFNISLRYSMQDKIIVTADAFARNSIYARTFDDVTGDVQRTKIHGFHVDTSFGIEYRYTQILSVFLNLNNVQNQPLERWYNYPSQRFNIMGGVSYAF